MKIYHYETIPSTNAEAKRMILDGAREGVLLAKHRLRGGEDSGEAFSRKTVFL